MGQIGIIQQNKIIAVLFLLLLALCSAAQSITDTLEIEEVQVIARKKLEDAASSTTKIDTLVLQMLKTQSVSELLGSYTPVFIKSYGRGSSATASFRGTAPSHTQVYWNGLKINSPMRGDVDFSLFPVYFIDDLNLQHGGSSLQSGAGALGGSVLIGNRPDWADRLSIKYVQTIESFTTTKEYVNVGFGNGKFQSKTRMFDDRSKNNFLFYNYGVLPMHQSVQKNAGYRKSGLLQEMYYRFYNQSVSAKIWAYQSDRKLPQLMSFEGDMRNETQSDQQLRATANWKLVKGKFKMEWVSGLNMSRLNYFRSSTEANFVNFDSRSSEKSYVHQFNFDWKPRETMSFSWSLNSTYDNVSVYDYVQKTGYTEDRYSFSLLNSVHLKLSKKVAFMFLVRSECYDGQLIGFIPAVGTEYWLDEKQLNSVKFHLSRNFHEPGLNDLYWIPGGNPDLKPEDGYSFDLSYEVKAEEKKTFLTGQLTGFASLVDNWIVWQPSVSGAYYWEAGNLRKVFARGVEFTASGKMNCANDIVIYARGNYSYTATSNIDALPSVDESRGKQLIYIPKHKANLFSELDFRSYYLKINAPFTGKRYTSSNNVESAFEKVLNPYWLINLTFGRTISLKPFQVDLSFTVENLANTDYMAILWRPMPGRYYSLTAQIQFRK